MKLRLRIRLRLLMAWAAGLATVALGALGVVCFGVFDTTASTPHPPLIAWATHVTMQNAVRRNARRMPPPPRFTPADAQRGFRLYEANCVMCHGGPGIARAAWVSGMTPAPPYLLDAARRWSPNELYWIVRQGVRMTAMPAWDQTLSVKDDWDLVAFLEQLQRLTPADYARLKAAAQPEPGAAQKPSPP